MPSIMAHGRTIHCVLKKTIHCVFVLVSLYSCDALRIHSESALKNKSCYAIGPDVGPKSFGRSDVDWWKCENVEEMCNGQNCEDKVIYKRFFHNTSKERNGIFLEAGGLNGVTFSNTLLFEQCFDWEGMLIEGSSDNFRQLVKNRPCTKNVHSAICDAEKSEIPFSKAEGVSQDLSAVNGNLSQVDHEMVPCRRLKAILQDNEISHIDFLSLDVEGAEEIVLKTVDFKKVSISVLMLERDRLGDVDHPSPESKSRMARIRKLLTSNGLVNVPSDPREFPRYDWTRLGRGINSENEVWGKLGIAGSDLYVAPAVCKYDACPSMNCEPAVTQHCFAPKKPLKKKSRRHHDKKKKPKAA